MRSRVVLPDRHGLCLDGVVVDEELSLVEVAVHSAAESATCPCCGRNSTRLHSWYQRRLTDLPWQGIRVVLVWRTRKFFCRFNDCQQKVFAEQNPQIAKAYARRTERLGLALRCIAFACGGEGGARLADRLGIDIHPDALLREIRKCSIPTGPVPRVLGVDDWAFRKGQRYGTVLVDLERGRPVELLPDRDAESLKAWLRDHPGVEIISRDRAECYIKGATEGAPDAIQVADRFHLMRNMRESLIRLIQRHANDVRTAADKMNSLADGPAPESTTKSQADCSELPTPPERSSLARQTRHQRYEEVRSLHQRGLSIRQIARQLNIHRSTVKRFLYSEGFPERADRRYSRQTDSCSEYLRKRWQEGCHNARQLTKEIQERGFTASYYSVTRQVAKWRQKGGATSRCHSTSRYRVSPQELSWLLLKADTELSKEDRSLKTCLLTHCPELEKGWRLATEFTGLFKDRAGDALARWLDRAVEPSVPTEIRNFAKGLMRDASAVVAAITLPWSNGQTEGQVNRLKTLKRQMYGRASFDLLRIRFLSGV